MASILFTVLKIVGIAFLVILGLVILILLLVMFVPVRYRGMVVTMTARFLQN